MANIRELDVEKEVRDRPHVVVLGSGASRAAVPNGDKNGRVLPLVKDLVEIVQLEGLLDNAGIDWRGNDFEDVFSGIADDKILGLIEDRIDTYFDAIEIPEFPTIYDHLVLSLRKKDFIATFNWDPLIFQALARHPEPECRPEFLLLHGNIKGGICYACERKGVLFNRCSQCGKRLEQTKIFYLTHNKRYDSDDFIRREWEQFEVQMSRAAVVTVFGYAAPQTDTEARARMLAAWNKNPYRDFAEFEIINTAEHDEVMLQWKDFIVGDHYRYRKSFDQSYIADYPRRSVEALFSRDMQCKVWEPQPLRTAIDLADLHAAAKPLMRQESEWPADKR